MARTNPIQIKDSPILITGASAGIGYATALHLDRAGFRVFAGIRSHSDADRLKQAGSARLTPLTLDVTDNETIRRAAALISEATGGKLYGLVNNAGVSFPSVIELMSLANFRKLLDVNLIGPVAVVQVFLPLLRQAKGRIVNIGSMNGRVSMMGIGGYSASKFGLDAISDALRLELGPSGIHVSLINPGQVKTSIFNKAQDYLDTHWEKILSSGLRESYEQIHRVMLWALRSGANTSLHPERVAKVIKKALLTRNPRARYSVGVDASLLIFLKRLLPDRLMDLFLIHGFNALSKRK